jgi:tetratricopeptide (TPR) repeat protein
MPVTEFARMRRSDHSMRPPMPSASVAFKSPNACNLCHSDRDAVWADNQVRKWHTRDHQKPVLHVASLVDAARKHDWSRLTEMLDYVTSATHDEVFANSLVRLLRYCEDEKKLPAFLEVLKNDASPLVRASAADSLGDRLTSQTVEALLAATRDEYRLVRVRAAASLAAVPQEMIAQKDRTHFDSAVVELEAALNAHPDDALSHYNLGNFYSARREFDRAISSYENAVKLRPDLLIAYVNASVAYNSAGNNKKAEQSLRKALEIDPEDVAANLNLGMLLGELERPEEAKKAFLTALKADPKSAQAAYNLGVITARDNINEGIKWCRRAAELRPDEPRYLYTLAFYQHQNGDTDGAIETLQQMFRRKIASPDAYSLLGSIYEQRGEIEKAIEVYRHAAEDEKLLERDRQSFAARIRALSPR